MMTTFAKLLNLIRESLRLLLNTTQISSIIVSQLWRPSGQTFGHKIRYNYSKQIKQSLKAFAKKLLIKRLIYELIHSRKQLSLSQMVSEVNKSNEKSDPNRSHN